MVREEPIKARWLMMSRLKDYNQLLKLNLSGMVVFSSVIGYLMAPGITVGWNAVILFIGGMLVTGGANTINQILERDSDKLMKRTMNRPMPDGRMGTTEAWIFAIFTGISGALLLGLYFNPLAGILSFLSLLLYSFVYTPMKKIHPISVFIGAIPGSLPPLIGWVAATGTIYSASTGLGGIVLFAIQFFWQFPHFWAIAWVAYDDYAAAGMRMLPTRERETRFTGLQCMFYSIVLVPMAILPRAIGLSGTIGMLVCMACGMFYFISSIIFYFRNDHKSARRVMYSSFIYLPTVLLALLFDKL
ncbi:MAG: heme o synthase [Flavipsychrobacter sp.]|nr:heme o synthase [Flavipsychrobacter sp.]